MRVTRLYCYRQTRYCALVCFRDSLACRKLVPLNMSLASIVHAHSYNLEAQVADGVFRSKQLGKRRAESKDSGAGTSKASTSAAGAAAASKWIPPTSASFYIPSLPGLDPDSSLTLYGGHLPSTVTSDTPASEVTQQQSSEADGGGDAHLFFFLAKAKHIAEREKLVVWLNGGEAQRDLKDGLLDSFDAHAMLRVHYLGVMRAYPGPLRRNRLTTSYPTMDVHRPVLQNCPPALSRQSS